MPSTAELIEAITDEGEFEKLAIAVLRRLKQADCGAVIHNGVNAKGETIPFLVDAEGLVSASQPQRYVLVQFTKTKRKDLKRKWLFDHLTAARPSKSGKRAKAPDPNDDGDLIKALRRVVEMRTQFPNAHFKVYLVSSSHGVGQVAAEVTAAGKNAGIETEIVDAGRLADFLDHTAEGELIRSHFFGTPVTRVSPEWLLATGRKSFLQRESRPDFGTLTNRVRRRCASGLLEHILSPSTGLVWVVASPGKGKSVTAVDAAVAYLEAGGFALWLSENDVELAETVWDAVDSALRRECKTLEPEAGKQVFQLVRESRRLAILVDDLNQLENPPEAFRKITAWVRTASSETSLGKSSSGPAFVVVAPIWPRHLDKLDSSQAVAAERPTWEQIFEIPNFSEEEASSLFSLQEMSALEVQAIAAELDYDPLLCSLTAQRLRVHPNLGARAAQEAISWFLSQQIEGVVAKTGRPKSEYFEAIHHLINGMLHAKSLRPKWAEVRGWIGASESSSRLTELFKGRAVVYCQPASETVLFNHDRFLDVFCADAITELLSEPEVISDPYYAETIGRAIAKGKLTEEEVVRTLEMNPLAVFCGLMFATSQTVKGMLAPILCRWARDRSRDTNLPSRLLVEIALVLLKTDSPTVVDLVGWLPDTWGLDLAALRNGSANYGMNYCRSFEQHSFMPGIRDLRRDAFMDHARSRHSVKIVADLNRDLQTLGLPLEARNGCLILAGFLGIEELTLGIQRCWENCPPHEQPETVAESIWATVRCAHSRFAELLPGVFDVWQKIPEQGSREHQNPRSDIAYYGLGHCSPRWMPEQVAKWLIGVLPLYPSLSSSLEHLLSQIDAPSAFEHEVRRLAARKREKGGDFALYFLVNGRWDPSKRHGYAISNQSLAALLKIWSNPDERKEDRECALRFWISSAKITDLPVLRSIGPEDPIYIAALQARMRLHDLTTVGELTTALPSNIWLLHHLPPVWSSSLHNPVAAVFRTDQSSLRHREDWITAFLISLPEAAAERLMTELWPLWGTDKGFQAAALLLSTAKAKDLVESALADPKTVDEIVKLCKFVIDATWPYINREAMLPKWLKQCVPYLPRVSQETLRRFSHLCRSPRTWMWFETNVEPLLKSEQNFEGGRRRLESVEAQCRKFPDLFYGAFHFFERVEERGLDKKQVIVQIADHTRKVPTAENVSWLAACLSSAGDRQDLSLLAGGFKDLAPDLLARIMRDARFAVMRRTLT